MKIIRVFILGISVVLTGCANTAQQNSNKSELDAQHLNVERETKHTKAVKQMVAGFYLPGVARLGARQAFEKQITNGRANNTLTPEKEAYLKCLDAQFNEEFFLRVLTVIMQKRFNEKEANAMSQLSKTPLGQKLVALMRYGATKEGPVPSELTVEEKSSLLPFEDLFDRFSVLRKANLLKEVDKHEMLGVIKGCITVDTLAL